MSPNSKGFKTQSVVKVKDPPNFNKMHRDLEEALERKRKENKTTDIKEFRFSSVAKDNISKIKPD